jgi:hypothetical protein
MTDASSEMFGHSLLGVEWLCLSWSSSDRRFFSVAKSWMRFEYPVVSAEKFH